MLPPSIPTSFVPRPGSAPVRRFDSDLTGAFAFFGYFVLFIVFVLAVGIFLYGRILSSTQASKDVALAKAESAVDLTTVENFVRLHDRLNAGATLLSNHDAFSNFFSLLDTLMPATVRFTTLHLSISDTKEIKIEGVGYAKSFNALAAASQAFSTGGHIKNAVFSNIVVSPKDNSVSFALTATLDPDVIKFSPSAPASTSVPTPSQGTSSTTPSL